MPRDELVSAIRKFGIESFWSNLYDFVSSNTKFDGYLAIGTIKMDMDGVDKTDIETIADIIGCWV